MVRAQDEDLNPVSASQVDPSCLASLPADIQVRAWCACVVCGIAGE